MTHPSDHNHYSYAIYSDPSVASQFDITHFGGPIGRLVAEKEEQVLLDFVGDLQKKTVLDVGTGTGRAALAMARKGAQVTGLDASPEMLKVARTRLAAEQMDATFLPGDAHSLAFPDRSFDVVVSLRMLMHVMDWRRCLNEFCRVARQRVIFDYPPTWSAPAFQVGMRRAEKLAGRNVETYRVISTASVRSVLTANGFDVMELHRQFVLPIALHKSIGSVRFTVHTERALAAMGLLSLVGAPVTILAEKIRS
jgi:ubiquinone/menaquinone biosynthesis C-methylase UbiE